MIDTVDEVIEKWKKVRDMYSYQSLPKTGLDIVIAEVERLRAVNKIFEAANVRQAELLERLKDELAETKAENVDWEESHDRIKAELAAAKAASVVPKIEAGYRMAYTLGTNSILIECDFSWDAKVIAEWVQQIKKHSA